MQILREVLGETCSRYRPGQDGGRDGWYVGQVTGLLGSQNNLNGNFIIQCKHTSQIHEHITKADLAREHAKVSELAANSYSNYILMTNRQVSAPSERAIREAFEEIPGIEHCIILPETWIEDTIDSNPRLLRLVPRLYGIGDLSQLLSFSIEQQSLATLTDLADSLRTFVPTLSYRRAEDALDKHGFVVLVGPPASGKSSIASNLCMVRLAQYPHTRILRIDNAEQFTNTWSPLDQNTIFWVDDVFGETTLDDVRFREWSTILEKVESARKRNARIIFCTRDYILAAVQDRLKASKANIINDAEVRVDVLSLTPAEKEDILYNHIKDGDISKGRKTALKTLLPATARLDSFTPELARRLGNQRFSQSLHIDPYSLRKFFDHPVDHLRDILRGLSPAETAALAVCFMSGNHVPDPVPEDSLAKLVLMTYGVSLQQIRLAFENLEGSLVKRVRQGTDQFWQLHHPSMIEALQGELSAKSSQLVLYLQGARLASILRDTSTLATLDGSRTVFLSELMYPYLIARFNSPDAKDIESVAFYLAKRSSDELLKAISVSWSGLLDRALAVVPMPDGHEAAPLLAVRLANVAETPLLDDRRRDILSKAFTTSIARYGWLGFLEVPDIDDTLGSFIEGVLSREISNGYKTIETLYGWYSQDLSSTDEVGFAMEALEAHGTRLLDALIRREMSEEESESDIEASVAYFNDLLKERMDELEANEDAWEDMRKDDSIARHHAYRVQVEVGKFSDVDE